MLDESERQGIEKEYLSTWDDVEEKYKSLSDSQAKVQGKDFDWTAIRNLLQDMRDRGYDHCFELDCMEGVLLLFRGRKGKRGAIILTASSSETIDIYAKILNREYKLLAQPMLISHELQMLLELLMALPIK